MKKIFALIVLLLLFWTASAFEFTNWFWAGVTWWNIYYKEYYVIWEWSNIDICVSVDNKYFSKQYNKKAVLYIKWYWFLWNDNWLNTIRIVWNITEEYFWWKLTHTTIGCRKLREFDSYRFMSNIKEWFVNKKLDIESYIKFYVVIMK